MQLKKYLCWRVRGRKYRKEMKKRLKNNGFTIISSNCIGGMVYHMFDHPFLSPTINLSMSFPDFVCFCSDLEHYLNAELKTYQGDLKWSYPMADLDGLTLHMVHYKSFEQAKADWERRAKRVDFDNLFLVASARDGFTQELAEQFDALVHPKVLFVGQKDSNPDHFYIKGFENEKELGDVTAYIPDRSGKRYYELFDWASFFNRNRT